MAAIWGWLKGRKTYILAGLVVLTILVLVYLGRMTPEAAYTVALFALAGFAVTFRDALAEHQAQVISVLMDVGQLGVAVRNHNREGELAVGQDLTKQIIAAGIASDAAVADVNAALRNRSAAVAAAKTGAAV